LSGADGDLGVLFRRFFGAFDFDGITLTLPTRTFDGRLALDVAGRAVELIEVGPAHTRGDVVVHLPDDGVVFTGDILFVGGTPIVWAGPLSNWIAACDVLLGLGAEVVVPGHGPVTDDAGIIAVRDYLSWVEHEAALRHAAGMTAWEAARDIALGPYGSWGEAGRLAVNVEAAYRSLEPEHQGAGIIELFGRMAELEGAR
jgi:glyoxylase-like metal-dependent hydrolase (beta-lactamase superfamily II)